jgi:hypothetical protein
MGRDIFREEGATEQISTEQYGTAHEKMRRRLEQSSNVQGVE